jgi:hypothetical protein
VSQVNQTVGAEIEVISKNKKTFLYLVIKLDVLQEHGSLPHTTGTEYSYQTALPSYLIM